jgi:predicted ester cyclase
MHRPIVALFACLLLTATGLGLLGVATTVTQAPLAFAPAIDTAAAAAAVDRFYAAADEALRTGDAAALDAAVAPGYRDHAAPAGSRPGAAGYARFLAELRTACPDCQLAAEELVLGHDQAAVRVAVEGHRQGTAQDDAGAGPPLAWAGVDVLRIAGGQIAERWSWGDALSSAEPLLADFLVESPAGSGDPQVARFVLLPGAALPPLTATEPVELAVEAGALAVRTDGVNWIGETLQEVHLDAVLGRGERLVLTPGMHHTVRNDGPAPAVVRVVAIEPVAVLPEPGRHPVATPCLRRNLAMAEPVACGASG